MDQRIKNFIFWGAIALLCFVGIPINLKSQDTIILEKAFQNYTTMFNKTYDASHYQERFHHFLSAMERIKSLNAQGETMLMSGSGQDSSVDINDTTSTSSDQEVGHNHHHNHKYWQPGMPKNQGSAVWGVTKFADMSPTEFQTKILDPSLLSRILKRQEKKEAFAKHHVNDPSKVTSDPVAHDIEDNKIVRKKRASTAGLPAKVDWRDKGIITSVKHQKNCGACWAFSTIETVESMHALQKGTLKSLSVQQVIDCAENGNQGCSGGDTCAALSWMTSTKLATESEYPTTLQDGFCLSKMSNDGVQISANFTCENLAGSEAKILQALANHGPVVAAVDATNWQYYVGGVIQWNCDANNNHAVQIVGYDNTAKPPHYIVRNSWGSDFGDKGYLYVAIGSNLCGIAREVSWLTVK